MENKEILNLYSIIHKLKDSQPILVYYGTEELYRGRADKLYLNIKKEYYEIEIDTLGTENGYLMILLHYGGYR